MDQPPPAPSTRRQSRAVAAAPPRRSTREKRKTDPSQGIADVLATAPKRKRRARDKTQAAPPGAIPDKALRYVQPSAANGETQVPATVFLADDLLTVMWTLDEECSKASCSGPTRADRMSKRHRTANILAGVDTYFAKKKAADDSAFGRARTFRHIGVVHLDRLFHTPDQINSFVACSEAMPGLANVEPLIPLLRSRNPSTSDLIRALHQLSAYESSQWETPFILAVATTTALDAFDESPETFTIQIYAGRLLFELIGNRDIAVLFDALQNGASGVVKPLPTRPSYPEVFERSPAGPDQNFFSFPALLRRAESLGYADLEPTARETVEKALTIDLLPFQSQTVQWMIDREKDPFSINDYFWRSYMFSPLAGSSELPSSIHYFPTAGEVRLNRPPTTRGGMVTDEMGLGKTISALGLIVAQTDQNRASEEILISAEELQNQKFSYDDTGFVFPKQEHVTNVDTARADAQPVLHLGDTVLEDQSTGDRKGPLLIRRWPPKTTLVVLPHSLLSQWASEVRHKAPQLRVFEWKTRRHDEGAKLDPKIAIGEDAVDIVLITYEKLRRDNLIGRVQWARVILDEAQNIRKSFTHIARDVLNLRTKNRFMMTGTPLTKCLSDIAGEMAFLKVWPFTLESDGFWESKVLKPWNDRISSMLLDELLSICMIRHTKSQKGLGIELPPRSYRTIQVSLTNSHRAVYCYIWASLLDELDREGTKDLRVVRTLFNLLRLSCISADLVGVFALDFARRTVWRTRAHGTQDGVESAEHFRQVSGKMALEFIAQAGVRMNRDTTRTYAMPESQSKMNSLREKTTSELRTDLIAHNLYSENDAARLSRDRIIAILAGGIDKLETDSLQELRRQAVDLGLVSETEHSAVSKERALALVRKYHLEKQGIKDASRAVHSAGFQALNALVEGGEAPTCPVCIGPCEIPALTKCAHFYCRLCLQALFNANPIQTRCAVCRRGIDPEADVVEVLASRKGLRLNAPGVSGQDDEDDEGGSEESVEIKSGDLREPAANDVGGLTEEIPDDLEDFDGGNVAPWDEYSRLCPPPEQYSFVGRAHHAPSLDTSFLRHLQAARDEGSPKLHALLELILSVPSDEKFVVVAEATSTLQCIGKWLHRYHIGSVGADMESYDEHGHRIRQHEARSATEEFLTNPSKRVFLLNTAAASGLTLTRATYVIFMGPLSRKADEIQASARVHRIGQKKPVQIIRIVTVDSVEHGLLKRRHGAEGSSAAEEAAALSGVSFGGLTDSLIFELVGRSMNEVMGYNEGETDTAYFDEME